MVSSFSSPLSFSSTATVSRTLYTPFSRTDFTRHPSSFRPKGTMIRWVNSPSGTLPTASPAVTWSPGFTRGVNSQSLLGMGSRYTPRCRKKPHCCASSGRGFCRPSNTWVSRPGPSSTLISSPESSTLSPTWMPLVIS